MEAPPRLISLGEPGGSDNASAVALTALGMGVPSKIVASAPLHQIVLSRKARNQAVRAPFGAVDKNAALEFVKKDINNSIPVQVDTSKVQTENEKEIE